MVMFNYAREKIHPQKHLSFLFVISPFLGSVIRRSVMCMCVVCVGPLCVGHAHTVPNVQNAAL